eukprot:TRINITY_DN401_c0_g1_i17.p1 TRINITY_DN401_c0_g1~~TRINITY_DN401_c0_g1_i17.p1  ORF type:complete len:1043 (-),score=409.51 TRINITY_DN401_c0_g1_i17:35-3106(-)
MKLKEVDRLATVAWCKSPKYPSLIAAGSAAGTLSIDFDTSSQLEIFNLDVSSKELGMASLGKASLPDKLFRLEWGLVGQNSSYPYGILAGGMENGAVSVWNPETIIQKAEADPLISTSTKHTGPVHALDFNPLQNNLLASGSGDSEIFIWDLSNPTNPTVYTPGAKTQQQQNQNITCVSWNKKVPHILSSASFSGQFVVWDLKNKKPVLTFTDLNRKYHCKTMAWNPEEATQLITASEDDACPVLQIWDLRNAYAPLRTMEGHSKGIWSISWCPFDTSLLLSCAKDNRTVCWNVTSGEILSEVERTTNWNFDVQWSPRTPAILSTCSLEGKIRIHSLHDTSRSHHVPDSDSDFLGTKTAVPPPAPPTHPPRWLQRPIGASFGFGGRLVSFSKKKAPHSSSVVRICTLSTEKTFVKRARHLEEVIKNQNFQGYCNEKIDSTKADQERTVWRFIKVLFEPDARQQLLSYLGFDPSQIAQEIKDFIAKQAPITEDTPTTTTTVATTPTTTVTSDATTTTTVTAVPEPATEETVTEEPPKEKSDVSGLFGNQEEDVFSNLGATKPTEAPAQTTKLSPQLTAAVAKGLLDALPPLPPAQPITTDDVFSRALIVGNFEAAVESCLASGHLADALVLAECGGPELYKKTREVYFQRQQKPFTQIIAAIIKKDLRSLVAGANFQNWRGVLAILCTYANQEFPELCDLLGRRLENVDPEAANLCHICAGNIESVLHQWISQYNKQQPSAEELQELVEKVSILRCAIEQDGTEKAQVPNNVVPLYERYAELLASQGLLTNAMQYLSLLKHTPESATALLAHRVFGALPVSLQSHFNAPEVPFQTLPQEPSSDIFGSQQQHQHHQQQHQQHQQHQEQHHQQQQQPTEQYATEPASDIPFAQTNAEWPQFNQTTPQQPSYNQFQQPGYAQPAYQPAAPQPTYQPTQPAFPNQPAYSQYQQPAAPTHQTSQYQHPLYQGQQQQQAAPQAAGYGYQQPTQTPTPAYEPYNPSYPTSPHAPVLCVDTCLLYTSPSPRD